MPIYTREVAVDQFLDTEGVIFLWNAVKQYVAEHGGSGSGSAASPMRFYTMETNVTITNGDTINVPTSYYVGDTTDIAQGDTAIGIIKQSNVADKLVFSTVMLVNGGNTTVSKILLQEIPTGTTINNAIVTKFDTFFSDYCNHFWAAFNNESALTVGSSHQIFKTNFITPPGIGTYVTGIVTVNGNDHVYVVQGNTSQDPDDPTQYVRVNLLTIAPILTATQIEAMLGDYPKTTEVETMINAKISNVYRYKGSVASYENLPTSGMVGGDVWNTTDTDMNYGWVEAHDDVAGHWDPLGQTFSISPIPNSVIQQIVSGSYGQ